MARVMIRCRVSDQLVPTGLQSHPEEWDARWLGTNRVVCASCKETHAWDKADAVLETHPAPAGITQARPSEGRVQRPSRGA